MKDFIVKVTKLTDIDLLHKVASFTSGRESKMSLLTAYKNKHSIIRSQLFVVELVDIPLFCASQFVRSTQGTNWYQRTRRTDRGSEDFNEVCRNLAFGVRPCWISAQGNIPNTERALQESSELSVSIEALPGRFDRYAPTDLCGIMNAEAIMNMSAKRLCSKVSKETREIWESVLMEVAKVDPDLVKFCVKPCVEHCGICREHKPCGYNKSEKGKNEIENYKKLFEK